MSQDSIKKIIQASIAVKTSLSQDQESLKKIARVASVTAKALRTGHKVLIFGNGGSAADSQHFAAELIGRFQKERQALAALALSTDTSILTSLANDYSFDCVFSRQLEALGRKGDVVFALSTSGQSKNVLAAVACAKRLGMTVVGLTGKGGGRLARAADIALVINSSVTARIQEVHSLVIHILCEMVEESLSA